MSDKKTFKHLATGLTLAFLIPQIKVIDSLSGKPELIKTDDLLTEENADRLQVLLDSWLLGYNDTPVKPKIRKIKGEEGKVTLQRHFGVVAIVELTPEEKAAAEKEAAEAAAQKSSQPKKK
jgi:hypothetical protein